MHNQRLVEQLKALEQESFEIQARIRRGIEVERENENITRNVEAHRDREREMARGAEELKGTLRQRDLEIERLTGKLDNQAYFQRQVEQELAQVKAENLRVMEMLNSQKTEEIRGEQRKNQFELEIIDLKRTTQQLRDEKSRQQAENAQLRQDLDEEVAKSKAYQQQGERLRALVDNLDHTKEELVRRLQSTNQEKITEEQTAAVLN